jgi:hypothetical protein
MLLALLLLAPACAYTPIAQPTSDYVTHCFPKWHGRECEVCTEWTNFCYIAI